MNGTAIGVIGWIVGAAVWFWWLRRYDRFEPEPLRSLLLVGILGGFASGELAGLGNHLAALALGIAPGFEGFLSAEEGLPTGQALAMAMFVGFNEEILKAVAAVTCTRFFGSVDEPVDAILYSMITALGFAVAENIGYALAFGADTLLPRYLLPTPLHVVLALIWGNAWAKGRFLEPRRPLGLVMAPAVCVASLLHGAWDYAHFARSAAGILLGLVGLVTLAIWAHATKRAIAMESPFVKPGVCPGCATVNVAEARYCGGCGRSFSGRYFVQCTGCRCRMPARAAFCPLCGVARA